MCRYRSGSRVAFPGREEEGGRWRGRAEAERHRRVHERSTKRQSTMVEKEEVRTGAWSAGSQDKRELGRSLVPCRHVNNRSEEREQRGRGSRAARASLQDNTAKGAKKPRSGIQGVWCKEKAGPGITQHGTYEGWRAWDIYSQITPMAGSVQHLRATWGGSRPCDTFLVPVGEPVFPGGPREHS